MSAVKYMDGYFNVFWQPELLDGSRLYVSDGLYLWMTPDLNYGFASPKVYNAVVWGLFAWRSVALMLRVRTEKDLS